MALTDEGACMVDALGKAELKDLFSVLGFRA